MKRLLLIIGLIINSLIANSQVTVGAEQITNYLPLIQSKRIALVVNQTSLVNNTHLLDTLLSLRIDIRKVFAPEHGFRGTADAGETIKDTKDVLTNTPVISIYGKNKKPSEEQLMDVDVVIFDIQDVGARFYTYISTLHYIMEACAENNKLLLVLDRPNPNDYIDGPVLKDKKFSSFVGVDPLPILHGCTVGELALMINGEKWLKKGMQCQLEIIKVKGWQHGQAYSLQIKPSPNLPNDQAIKLYPSLCLFEGTGFSVGRGTHFPFQVIGYPDKKFGSFVFTPKPILGMDSNPVQLDNECYGIDLRNEAIQGGFHLTYLLQFYALSGLKEAFFTQPSFFDKLAGTDELRKQIIAGKSEQEIRYQWQKELEDYKKMREKYLLYN